ncbi:hypothetical protein OPT61_g5008 [Boeremia exigua]|uniref:Uncharacterized protein n=1 Tax=Boeremia exigua TaxID=749465 RepID=A0ACC2IBW1_9PLEO|nr:hypothetical protein OPT61_g5008 [Boeremia exigua]
MIETQQPGQHMGETRATRYQYYTLSTSKKTNGKTGSCSGSSWSFGQSSSIAVRPVIVTVAQIGKMNYRMQRCKVTNLGQILSGKADHAAVV